MILSKERDRRLITIRRGGTLTDAHHHLLARWAAECAAHVLQHFEAARPDDDRPRKAIELTYAWIRGEISMKDAHSYAFVANAAARDLQDAARFAALATGQAVAVAHVAEHDLGAAAYAIRAAAAATPDDAELARQQERDWQRAHLPDEVRALVLEDQQRRNAICWSVFD